MVPYKNPLYTVYLKTMAKPDLTFLQCVRVALIFLRGRHLPLSHISRKYQLTLLYSRLACLVNTENEMVCWDHLLGCRELYLFCVIIERHQWEWGKRGTFGACIWIPSKKRSDAMDNNLQWPGKRHNYYLYTLTPTSFGRLGDMLPESFFSWLGQ